jgi:hypothetical protein
MESQSPNFLGFLEVESVCQGRYSVAEIGTGADCCFDRFEQLYYETIDKENIEIMCNKYIERLHKMQDRYRWPNNKALSRCMESLEWWCFNILSRDIDFSSQSVILSSLVSD